MCIHTFIEHDLNNKSKVFKKTLLTTHPAVIIPQCDETVVIWYEDPSGGVVRREIEEGKEDKEWRFKEQWNSVFPILLQKKRSES